MRFSILTSILSASLLLGGCDGGGGGMVARVGNGAEPKDLDPHITTGVPEHSIQGTLFNGLTLLDPETLEPEPGAAASWTVSDDKLHYTFKMQPDGKWSNGDPVTAHDFVYSWTRILSPRLASDYAYLLHCIQNAKAFNLGEITDFGEVGVKAADDMTLEVDLEHPTPYFLSMQVHNAWFPVHQPTIEAHGVMDQRGSRWTRVENFVGNGPFVPVEWSPGELIRAERNPHYWNAAGVKLDAIEFYPVDDMQTEERMFRKGELHLTETIPLHAIAGYNEENPELVHLDPWLGTYFYRFNTTRPPLDDKRVRQALSLAIDRDEMAKNVFKGGEPAAKHFTPPGMAGFNAKPRFEFDVERAKALLAEAGYPNGEGMETIEILYNTAEQHKTIAEVIQSMWKEHLGIDVQLLNQDWKVYQDSEKNLNYWTSRAGWIGDFVAPINCLECFLSGGGNNRTGFANAEYDRLINAAYRETDTEKRFALLDQAEAIIAEEVPLTPLYFYTTKYLKAPELKNLPPNIMRYRRWDLAYLESGGE